MGEKVGWFLMLTSPSGCGRDKCPFRTHHSGQLRPGQAEALCIYRGISKKGDYTSIKEKNKKRIRGHTEALTDCIILGASELFC